MADDWADWSACSKAESLAAYWDDSKAVERASQSVGLWVVCLAEYWAVYLVYVWAGWSAVYSDDWMAVGLVDTRAVELVDW